MRKATSFLLALVMLVGMLPGAAMTVSAASAGQLQAYYTGDSMTVDGKLDEAGWLLNQSVGSTPVALLCSFDSLYVGLQTRANKATMMINGAEVVANLSAGTVTIDGEASGKTVRSSTAGTVEIEIPLSSVGVTYDLSQEVPFALTVDADSFDGTAVLATRKLVFSEDCRDASSKTGISNYLGSSSSELYAEGVEDGLHYKTGTMTKDGNGINVPAWTITKVAPSFDIYKGYELSFSADFNDLAVPDPAGSLDRLALTGFSIDLRASKRCMYGFHADAAGNIYVVLYNNYADAVQPADTGLDLPVKDVDVRFVVNDDFETEVFINGKSVATFPTSSRPVSGDNILYFGSSSRYRGSDDRKNDLVLRDIVLTQDAPARSLPVDILPRAGVINQDGKISETCWGLESVADGVMLDMLCDTENLYMALKTNSSSAKFNVGDYTINATLGKNPKIAVGYTMGSTIAGDGSGSYEITIPLHLMKLDNRMGEEIPLTISSGSTEKVFAMKLGASLLSLAEYVPVSDDGLRNATAYLNTDKLILDGALKENQWHIAHEAAGPATAPAADFGFLWDGRYVYIGTQVFSASQAQKLELTMAGKTVTADLVALTATAGDIVVQGQTSEWRVPLADLGVKLDLNLEEDYKLSVTSDSGTSFIQGKLLFAAKSMILGDACRDFNTKDYTVITASSVKYTKWDQGDGYYYAWTDSALGSGNEAHQHFTPLLNYAGGGDYEFEFDLTIESLPYIETTRGWRGLCWELREPELQTRFNFRSDGKDGIVIDYLDNAAVGHSIDTGIKFGQRATYTIKVNDQLIPTVYVNGEYAGTFPILNRTTFDIKDNYHMPRLIMQIVNHTRALNEDGTLSAVNAQIHDIKFVKNIYDDVQGMLDNTMQALTEDSVLAGGNPDPKNVTALNLPAELTGYGLPCQVKWTAIDCNTGKAADYVNLKTGVVTVGARPAAFDLIADVSYEGISATKTFTFTTTGSQTAGNVALIENDMDPRVGQATDWTRNEFAYFDTTHNSLVFDQGSSKPFNTITLRDLDELSRVSQQHLGVFISEDGKTYTKVNGWLMHQDGSVYTLHNLNAKARYVKVHTYHDNLEREGELPSFYNSIRDMISVSNEQYLPGANGTFANKAEYVVKNSTAAEQKDMPVFISLADLGAKAGQYKADASDFRFTMGTTTLAHWYNGVDGFYIRVPAVAANGSVKVTAQWGCADAVDFSNAENVFEVVYGNVTLFDLSAATDFSSHGRPFTLSNGEIIVVGRRYVNGAEHRGLGLVRSTDGGRTFSTVTEPVMDGFKNCALGFGGYLYDDQIDRLYLIAYVGSVADSNDYRLALCYTDDCGKTWSEQFCLSNPTQDPVDENDIVVPNMNPNIHRAIIYCDGLALKERDGDGPNTDYVIVYNDTDQSNGHNVMTAVYSKDGGKTWLASENYLDIGLGNADGAEMGVSEPSFTQLDDGSLLVFCRCQEQGNYYLYEGRSTDGGNTWTGKYSHIISSNTSSVMTKYNGERLLMWSSYNGEGGASYRRAPMHMAYTLDEYKSFEKVIDLTFGTSYDGLHQQYYHFTQPGIAFTPDGKDAVVTFWEMSSYRRFNLNQRATAGFLIEDFDQMLHNTKGGYEDFETASLKYEGWLKRPTDMFELSNSAAASGQWSMKLNGAQPVHATRQLPSMKSGTVGAKVMAPAANTANFYMTLKAGFNFVHLQHALATVGISGDGTISVAYPSGNKSVAKVTPGSWVDLAISFDIPSKMGKLSVNGKVVSDITLNLDGPLHDQTVENVIREITCVQFTQPNPADGKDSFLYVDDFYAIEQTTALTRSGAASNVEPPKQDEPKDELGFADVKAGDWFYDAVSYAVANDIMSGYNATTFGPNDILNRAMVVQLLYNKEGKPALNGLTHNFSDVPASQWFNNAVTWGSNKGVVSGFGGGVFKPEDAVTIEQIAVILRNYSGSPNGNGDLSKVGNHSDWAADALRWAVEKGILNNVPFTNATEKATRAQAAQMLTNYLRAN